MTAPTLPVPRVALAPGYTIPRVITGGWQLAGGHGPVDRAAAIDGMRAFVDAGLTAFDCADIYTGVEELFGEGLAALRRDRGAEAARGVQVHTKYVPDLDALATLTRAQVEATVDRSLRRLGVEALDLVQLHWWDYDVPGWVQAALWLDDLRRVGKVRHIGVTNFDVAHLRPVVEAGVPVVSHQVQYSLLDQRPAGAMAAFCAEHGIQLLCYGSIAGGFLSDRWLDVADPAEIANRSLIKYRLIVDECGGWNALQARLVLLSGMARRHGATIAQVAAAWTLSRPRVAAVIVGARGSTHLEATRRIPGVALDQDELGAIDILLSQGPGPAGDVYALERVKGGRHAGIMRYNLGRGH
jgi:aryl-alcohol dehydrogenase-like predicted oxidoreductase